MVTTKRANLMIMPGSFQGPYSRWHFGEGGMECDWQSPEKTPKKLLMETLL